MKAVILLSGGLDSATVLYYAKKKGLKTYCITFQYGQRHKKEVNFAKALAVKTNSDWKLLDISFPWKGSSLIDKNISLPKRKGAGYDIPNTYVPGRNIIFLSYAVSYAEAIGAKTIFIGANQIDYSGYPDCRGSFLQAFSNAIKKGTRAGVKGNTIKIEAPLLDKNKKEIVKLAAKLKVPFKYTWSCYKGAKFPCGECDSCLLREKGFKQAKIKDPTLRNE